jgi:glycosyltransferase involved in cell wall biosynthesis
VPAAGGGGLPPRDHAGTPVAILPAVPAARFLTFNWHETYVHTLASAGGDWDVVLRRKAGRDDWWTEVRPFPANARVVEESTAIDRARQGVYRAAVCHNLLDLGLVVDTGVRTVTVFHTSKAYEVASGLDAAAFDRYGLPLLARTTAVFVSAMKQQTWGFDGVVVPPGIDRDVYDGWAGDTRAVLHVGNLKRELSAVNGMASLEQAVAGLPFTLLGLNPTIPGARLSASWDDLRAAMRAHRVYLHTSHFPLEDGYNLAMLEAMATGMPAAVLAHPTSPIVDGRDGRVAPDGRALGRALLELLEDDAEAARLGAAGRERVCDLFAIDAFRTRWRGLLRLN